MHNWKTSAAGLVAALATAIAPCLSAQWRPVAIAVGALAIAVGGLAAKDAGTPPTNPPTPPTSPAEPNGNG